MSDEVPEAARPSTVSSDNLDAPPSGPEQERARRASLTTSGAHGSQTVLTPEDVEDQIGRKEARRIRARDQKRHRVWFGLGMFGLVGWSVAVPTLLGTAIGMWIDRQSDGTYSWTLTCLILGLTAGCLMAWRWVRDESEVK